MVHGWLAGLLLSPACLPELKCLPDIILVLLIGRNRLFFSFFNSLLVISHFLAFMGVPEFPAALSSTHKARSKERQTSKPLKRARLDPIVYVYS